MANLDLSSIKTTDLFTDDGIDTEQTEVTEQIKPTNDEKDRKKDREEVLTDGSAEEEQKPVADESKKDEVEADDDSLVGFLSQRFGYDLGEQKFEDTPEGIEAFTKAVASKQFEEYIDKLEQELPDVVEYMEFRLNGGDPRSFYESLSQEVDYKQLSFGEEDSATQKRVLRDFYSAQGFDADTTGELIKNYETAGILFTQAKMALPTLVKLKENQKQKQLQEQQQQRQVMEQQQQQYLQEVQQTVQKGQLRDIKLSEADTKSFQNWLFKPVTKDGKTQRAIDREKLSLEDKLALEYLVHKGFNISSLVTAKAQTLNVQKFKEKLKGTQPVTLKGGKEQRQTSFEYPTLDSLF